MVDTTQNIQSSGFNQENLTPQKHRTLDRVSYLLLLIGAAVAINAFMLGASVIVPDGELNLVQGTLAAVVGLTIATIAMSINGRPGHKYGIPFVVQLRTSFGMTGAKIPGLIRAAPAVFWYGIQSWIGASAMNAVSIELMAYDNIVLYFITFQILQIVLTATGFKGVKWLENIGAIGLIIGLGYMFYVVYTNFNAEVGQLITTEGTWGLAFWGGVTAFLANFNTVALNISDLTRQVDTKATPTLMSILHWVGFVPITTFMGVIGIMVAGATGSWDPVTVFVEVMPNSTVLIVLLFFIALAQVTTNVVNNAIPATYVIMDVFRAPYVKTSIGIGILAVLTFPWIIQTSDVFQLFVQIYSGFLGPIFAVMIVDYYIVRRRNLNIEELYNSNGFYKGINWPGIIAIIVGALVGFTVVEIAWFISLVPAGLSYYLLMRYLPINKNFLKDSIFEDKSDGWMNGTEKTKSKNL
ncbi:NCS1 family transporter [Salibacterium lacus]|uniref:NCS1 family transporter n=1 Tax=Salibacterium lacus TaxID=1898109 RepID=A0ABW5T699_9BACI